jgi:hypothetical protein
VTNLNEALETVREAMLRDADTGTPKEFHDRMEALAHLEARLAQAEAALRDATIVAWAVVMAAGGEVRVPNALLVEDGDLHRFPHPALDGEVFRATRRVTTTEEGA